MTVGMFSERNDDSVLPNGAAGEPWPAGPSAPPAGSAAAGGRNQYGPPAAPFSRPSAVG